MISHLKGTALYMSDGILVVDCAGGVGYKANIPETLARSVKIGEEIALWTHMAVRENSMDLFGFSNRKELMFFEQLLTVSGIGPRSALSILNLAPVDELTRGISSGDASRLTSVSGIGRKTAQKIVLELKDKIGPTVTEEEASDQNDTLDALIALGYSRAEARDAVRNLSPDTKDTNAKIKEALRSLGGAL